MPHEIYLAIWPMNSHSYTYFLPSPHRKAVN